MNTENQYVLRKELRDMLASTINDLIQEDEISILIDKMDNKVVLRKLVRKCIESKSLSDIDTIEENTLIKCFIIPLALKKIDLSTYNSMWKEINNICEIIQKEAGL